MNKMVFFNRLKKALKNLPVDDQKYILKEYEFRYEQQKKNGLKERDIIATFGSPESIINAYYLAKNNTNNNINNDGNIKNCVVNDTMVEVHSSLDIIVPSSNETSNGTDDVAENNVEANQEDENVTVNDENDNSDSSKEKKEYKKIPGALIPLWLILILIVLALCLVVSLLYVPLFFVGVLIIIYGIYMVTGSIIHILASNIFGGLFQLGIAILTMVFGVLFICGVNLLLKAMWKGLAIMFKKMGGKKHEKKI